ncbi:MAG: rod shape-determining protein RodA [Bacteroidales bacterium]|nr:rod shape-determining protein RodA [Bacteroidales bacterium]
MNNKRNNILINLDWLLIIVYLALIIIGWINVFSVSYTDTSEIFDFSQRYIKQLFWIGLAFAIAISILLINNQFLNLISYPLYVLGILVLLSVLIFGTVVHSSKSWFQIGNFAVQPVEFVKIIMCLVVAKFMSNKQFHFTNPLKVLILLSLVALPILLVLLQNDTGSALVFLSFIFVFYREGLNKFVFFTILVLSILFILALIFPINYVLFLVFLFIIIWFIILNWKSIHGKIAYSFLSLFLIIASIILWRNNFEELFLRQYLQIIILSIISLISLILIILHLIKKNYRNLYFMGLIVGISIYILSINYVFNNVLQEHQRNRINELLGKTTDVYGKGYHVRQSKIAISSGEFTGKGFLNGTQTRYNFVPEQSTDFIFCTIGEEWGFIGTTLTLILFGLLICRIIYLSEKQRSAFARIYGYGLASILFFHVFVNIGMTVGLTPVIGIPLPFMSYGGSSLWAFTILLFIFIKLDSDKIQIYWE